MFPVQYQLNFYILFRRYSTFKEFISIVRYMYLKSVNFLYLCNVVLSHFFCSQMLQDVKCTVNEEQMLEIIYFI
jgi:hypothetical protein